MVRPREVEQAWVLEIVNAPPWRVGHAELAKVREHAQALRHAAQLTVLISLHQVEVLLQDGRDPALDGHGYVGHRRLRVGGEG